MTKSIEDPQLTKLKIQAAIMRATLKHFDQKQREVSVFCKNHFSYPGCWQTNKHAFAFDLVRAPINLCWATIYITLVLLFLLLSGLGFKQAKMWANKLPGGFTTDVQRYINQHILNDLIDAEKLKEDIIASLKVCTDNETDSLTSHSAQVQKDFEAQLETIVADSVKHLMLARTASADITNALISTAIGAFTLKTFTPGSIGLGIVATGLLVKYKAEENFFLGQHLGSWYYTLFPPEPSLIETSIGVISVMFAFAFIASLSGLITDPIQSALGLHQRRLKKLLTQLNKDIVDRMNSRFKPLDPYIARILELIDTLKSPLSM